MSIEQTQIVSLFGEPVEITLLIFGMLSPIEMDLIIKNVCKFFYKQRHPGLVSGLYKARLRDTEMLKLTREWKQLDLSVPFYKHNEVKFIYDACDLISLKGRRTDYGMLAKQGHIKLLKGISDARVVKRCLIETIKTHDDDAVMYLLSLDLELDDTILDACVFSENHHAFSAVKDKYIENGMGMPVVYLVVFGWVHCNEMTSEELDDLMYLEYACAVGNHNVIQYIIAQRPNHRADGLRYAIKYERQHIVKDLLRGASAEILVEELLEGATNETMFAVLRSKVKMTKTITLQIAAMRMKSLEILKRIQTDKLCFNDKVGDAQKIHIGAQNIHVLANVNVGDASVLSYLLDHASNVSVQCMIGFCESAMMLGDASILIRALTLAKDTYDANTYTLINDTLFSSMIRCNLNLINLLDVPANFTLDINEYYWCDEEVYNYLSSLNNN